MAVFGWIVTFLGGIFLSLVYVFLCTQTLGRYNTGWGVREIELKE